MSRKDLTPLKHHAARIAAAAEARPDAMPRLLYSSMTRSSLPFANCRHGWDGTGEGRFVARRTGAKTWRTAFEASAETRAEARDARRAIRDEKIYLRETDWETALYEVLRWEAAHMELRDAVLLDDIIDYPAAVARMPVERAQEDWWRQGRHVSEWLDRFARRLDFVEEARKTATGNLIRPDFRSLRP